MVKCTRGQVRRLKTALRWKGDPKRRQRIQMVLLRESGMPQPAIAEAMGVSPSTVNRAHMAYDDGGLAALKSKPSGGRKRENVTLRRCHDSGSERRAGMAGDRPHRHEEGLREPVAAGAGGTAARSAERTAVLLSWSQRRLLKVIWHDGQGACLFTKRLERGRFLWPSATDGAVTISSAQLGYLLSGIDWRNPQATWRPTSVG